MSFLILEKLIILLAAAIVIIFVSHKVKIPPVNRAFQYLTAGESWGPDEPPSRTNQ